MTPVPVGRSLKGSQVISQMLDGYGVSHVFFVPTILNHTLVEMERTTSIKRIVTHSEKAAAYMADGYARASGRPGVCMAQTVGAANLAAGLRDARLTSSPIVAITGGPFRQSRDRFQYQEIDDRPMFGPVTKKSLKIDHVDRVPAAVRQAFRLSTIGCPGPVHLEFVGHHGDMLELESTTQSVSVEERHGHLPPYRPAASHEEVVAAAQLLTGAQRPIVVAGGGVRQSGAARQLVAFAESFAIPVATSLTGKDLIRADHPLAVGTVGLYARDTANRLVEEADLVFMIGTKAGSQATHSWRFPSPSQTTIHLDIDPEVVGSNYGTQVPLIGDIATVLTQLEAAGMVSGSPGRHDWLLHVSSTISGWYEETSDIRNSDDSPMRPERLCKEISENLVPDGVLVADTGHAGMWAAGWIDLLSDDQVFLRAAGSLGWAFPAAIGAQCALPDRPVVAFTGDGGFWYHVAELETAARWDIPLTVVVNDNQSLNQEINIWTDAYGGELQGRHHELWQFRDVDIGAVSKAMGVPSVRVYDAESFTAAFKEATSTPGPFLIDAVTDMYAIAPPAYRGMP